MDAVAEKRAAAFQADRFGMFIHFGLYSLRGEGEWIKNRAKLTDEQYQPYFDNFTIEDFDAAKWAKLARQAGMKYAVLTAKHHDGFCLFDSKYTDYKSTKTPFGRDVVREFVDAFRAEGLKVGLYYSLLDWHHPDYPHQSDPVHPQSGNPDYPDEGRDFDRYLDYMHAQIREICENYGKLNMLWFDYAYGDMKGEKWRGSELIKMVRSLQPEAMIDNRLEGSGSNYGSLITDTPSPYAGDFVSPEQIVPPYGIRNPKNEPVPWEACVTMNNNWGYSYSDHLFKPSATLIRKLVECVSKGGNMILNVGPDGRGNIPPESVKILKEIGEWMQANGESIYGCGCAGMDKPDYGWMTRKGNSLYVHILDQPIGPVPVKGITKDQIDYIRLLSDGTMLQINRGWADMLFGNEYTFFSLGPVPSFTYPLADAADTVVEIRLK